MRNKITTAWQILSIIAVCIVLLLSTLYCVAEKEFKGYYPNKYSGGEFTIWVNWENRIDEKVFQTSDYDRFLEMYKILKAEEVSQK